MLQLESPPETRDRSAPDGNGLAEALIRRIGEGSYGFWFAGHTRITRGADTLTIGCRNAFCQERLRNSFAAAIQEAASEVYGGPLELRFTTEESTFAPAVKAATRAEEKVLPPKSADIGAAAQTLFDDPEGETSPPVSAPTPRPEPRSGEPPMAQRRWKTLAEFVVGPGNRVAHATAQSVIEAPGQDANPLVIHGPCGTGKTHLLEAIYTGLRRHRPSARLTFVTAEEFLNRFVQMMKTNKQANFRRSFRECDALFIDDLSFLAGKKGSQEEFLHTFDALLAEGRQVVATMDSHPRLCDTMAEELVDRLLGGTIGSLMPPDPETRLKILQAKTYQTNPPIPDGVLSFLANKLRGNVRELEGALHSIRHYSRVTARPVTNDLVQEALGDLIRHALRVVRIADVEAAVCDALHLPAGLLKSKQRTWMVSHPRMIAIYLARKHTAATYGEISAHFGNKTHSGAVAAEKRVKNWLAQNEPVKIGEREWAVRELIERIERALQR